MKQNLVESVRLTGEAHLSPQQLWNTYKSVAETPAISRPWPTKLSLQSSPLRKGDLHSPVAGDGPLALKRPDRAALEGGEGLVGADLGAARRFAFRGISPSSASIVHKPREARLVDVRRQLTARSYFQAVLSSKDVFAKGNGSFPSGKSAAF